MSLSMEIVELRGRQKGYFLRETGGEQVVLSKAVVTKSEGHYVIHNGEGGIIGVRHEMGDACNRAREYLQELAKKPFRTILNRL